MNPPALSWIFWECLKESKERGDMDMVRGSTDESSSAVLDLLGVS